MKFCQVAPYAAYPPRRGGDHRTHGIVKEFPSEEDSIIRFCQGGTPELYKSFDLKQSIEISKGYVEERKFHPMYEIVKAPMLMGYPNLFASAALAVSGGKLDRLMDESDVVLVREPWQMPYVLENIDSETPVVFSSHNVEAERFTGVSQPFFEEKVLERVAKLEQKAVEESDAVITTSHRDASVYREKYDPDGPMIVAPNGTYRDAIRKHNPKSDGAREVRERYGIGVDSTVCLFMGSKYQPNIEAVEAILRVAESVRETTPEIEFMIMGAVGDAFSEQDLPENVVTTGYVESDFEAHFDASDIALNSMLSGGGTNIKLIDYFARGVPVVSTPFGIRGLDVVEGEHLLVAEIGEFAEKIREMRGNPNWRREIGEQGRKIASESYTWESSSETILNQLKSLFDT